MPDKTKLKAFESAVLPHRDAAYNLARWLLRNPHDAEDVVQEAYMRAFKFFEGFRSSDGRVWLLAIVRNTCWTWLEKNGARLRTTQFDEALHSVDEGCVSDGAWASNPEDIALQHADAKWLHAALERLPEEFREVIILRELEGLSYKDIAKVTGAPLGTVMSRLARGRDQLQQRAAAAHRQGEFV